MSTRSVHLSVFVLLLFLVAPPALAAGIIFGGPGPGQPQPAGLLGRIPALCRLQFSYVTDDHHVLQMRAHPSSDGEQYHYAFNDNDPADRTVYGNVHWHDLNYLPGTAPMLHSSDEVECEGECEISMPSIPDDRVFALTGVHFEFIDHDRHLLEVMVRPDHAAGVFNVQFRDNGHPSYRVRLTTVSFQRTHASSKWVERTSLSTADEHEPILRADWDWDRLIQGFRARFMNGDHHLQEFDVNVCDDNEIKGVFRDKGDVDDPYQLDIWYIGRGFMGY